MTDSPGGGSSAGRAVVARASSTQNAPRQPDRAGGDPRRVVESPGRPLDASTRAFFESRFGHDFGRVRIHVDEEAAASARALDAHAYTLGHHVVFSRGEFQPDTPRGRRLLAHELAHVLQQRDARGTPLLSVPSTRPGDAVEAAARTLAGRALTASGPVPAPAPVTPRIAREEIEVDLEVPTPAERESLRRLGITLPTVSAAAADPRNHSDYIDRKVNAVGFGIYLGGYVVYCDGLPLPVFVHENHFDFGLATAATPDLAIYPDHASAVRAVPFGPPAPGAPQRTVTFYRGAGGGVVAPTVFSPATTPRVVGLALGARRQLAAAVEQELAVLAISLLGGFALRALIRRIARIGTRGPQPPRPRVPPGTGANVGREMAREMSTAGFRGNPFREFQRRLNARPDRLPPEEAAEAISVATREFSGGRMGTMPPVQRGNVLVIPSRAPIPNAPVMGVRSDGTVMMGRAPRIDLVRDARGIPVNPPQTRIEGDITWE